jgi:hypothetical protein
MNMVEAWGKGGAKGACRRFSEVRMYLFLRHSPLPKSPLFYPSDSYLTNLSFQNPTPNIEP